MPWVPWGWTNLGKSIFHWEDGSPWTKMHLNWSSHMPRSQWSLSELCFIHFTGQMSHFSKGHCSDLTKLDQSSQVFLWFTAFHISLWKISPGFGNHCHWKSLTEKYEKQWIREILVNFGPILLNLKVTFRKVIAAAWKVNVNKFWQAPVAPWHMWRPI